MAIKNKTKNYSIKNLTDPSTTHKLQKKIFIPSNTITKSTYYYLKAYFYLF